MLKTTLIHLNKLIYFNNLFWAGLSIVFFLLIGFGAYFIVTRHNNQKNPDLNIEEYEEVYIEPTEPNLVADENLDEEEGE